MNFVVEARVTYRWVPKTTVVELRVSKAFEAGWSGKNNRWYRYLRLYKLKDEREMDD